MAELNALPSYQSVEMKIIPLSGDQIHSRLVYSQTLPLRYYGLIQTIKYFISLHLCIYQSEKKQYYINKKNKT